MTQNRDKPQRVYVNSSLELVDEKGNVADTELGLPAIIFKADRGLSEEDLVDRITNSCPEDIGFFRLERIGMIIDEKPKLIMPVTLDPTQAMFSDSKVAYLVQYFRYTTIDRTVNKGTKRREELSDEIVPSKITDAWLSYVISEAEKDYENRGE